MTDFIRNHKPEWTTSEIDILYKSYYGGLTIKQTTELLPNRSFCAVKNKLKKIKYG